ncbi:hypothetical protein K469DRAFT_602435, partial [Zopfia rhizophila CBS 207.26]
EAKQRVHLPYHILSDEKLEFAITIKLSLFEWQGRQLVKILALAIQDGQIEKVWYPVFPPNKNALELVK